MIVENYMSKELITVAPTTKVNDAVELMNQHQIHRLPVLKAGELVGLITEGTIQAAMPSKATSLSVFEANYLLNKTTVADVMIKNVTTIQADALLEEAVEIMRTNNFGVLPVRNQTGELVGIITNNDIFAAFLQITGYQTDGVRVAIKIESDHQGVLADLSARFAAAAMNIVQIVVFRQDGQPVIVTQLTETTEAAVADLLAANDYDVVFIKTTTGCFGFGCDF